MRDYPMGPIGLAVFALSISTLLLTVENYSFGKIYGGWVGPWLRGRSWNENSYFRGLLLTAYLITTFWIIPVLLVVLINLAT